MDREVLVPLLKAVVLADVMQVVTSDNDGPLHLHFGHHTFRTDTESKFAINSFLLTLQKAIKPEIKRLGGSEKLLIPVLQKLLFVTRLHQCCH